MKNRALIVVDVQRDFCEGGSLAVAGGNAVAEKIADYVRNADCSAYQVYIFTKDWHEQVGSNGDHFADVPDYLDTWPSHCVQGTEGASFHPAISELWGDLPDKVLVLKGEGEPAYSAFDGTVSGLRLAEFLAEWHIEELDVVGIATDHCVRATVMDALEREFDVRVLTDMVVGVDADASLEALMTMAAAGATTLKG